MNEQQYIGNPVTEAPMSLLDALAVLLSSNPLQGRRSPEHNAAMHRAQVVVNGHAKPFIAGPLDRA